MQGPQAGWWRAQAQGAREREQRGRERLAARLSQALVALEAALQDSPARLAAAQGRARLLDLQAQRPQSPGGAGYLRLQRALGAEAAALREAEDQLLRTQREAWAELTRVARRVEALVPELAGLRRLVQEVPVDASTRQRLLAVEALVEARLDLVPRLLSLRPATLPARGK